MRQTKSHIIEIVDIGLIFVSLPELHHEISALWTT